MKKIIITSLLFLVFVLPCVSQNYSYQQELYESLKPSAERIGSAAGEALADAFFTSPYLGDEYKYGAIGLGYGASYGGIGAKLFGRFSKRIVAIGLSTGVGYNPGGRNNIEEVSDALFVTFGLQIYIENFCIDWQIGQMGRVKYGRDGTEKNQFGMAILGGYNWFFAKHCGLNVALGYGAPLSWSEKDDLNVNEKLFKGKFIAEGGILFRF